MTPEQPLRYSVGLLLLCCTWQGTPLIALDQASDPAGDRSRSDSASRTAPSSSAVFEDGTALGHVLSFDHLGNIQTSFVASDLARLGLAVGDRFELTSGDKSVDVYLGESVFEARLGEWVAFVSLEGRLIVSRSYGRAVTALKTDVDEPIVIRAAEEPADDGR